MLENRIEKIDKIGVFIFTVIFAVDVVYLSNTTANVPIMDYWRYGQEFLYEIFGGGGVRFHTFWESVNGQRGFLTYFLFFINVKWFHWNTRTAIFFGAVVTYATGLLLLKIFNDEKIMSNIKGMESFEQKSQDLMGLTHRKLEKIFKYLTILGIAVVLFNYLQWEIKTIEFSAPFSVSTLFVVVNLYLADRILNDLNIAYEKVAAYTILLSLCVCFVYSAFFPAVLGGIGLCGAFHFFTHYKEDGFRYMNRYLTVGIGMLCSAIIYLNGIQGAAGSNYNLRVFMGGIWNGEFLKAMTVYFGASLIHSSLHELIPPILWYILGGIVVIIYIIAFVLFYKNRKKINSYFPIMLMIYTVLTGVLLIYGRSLVYGVMSLSASRYAYQSKMGLIGILIIFYQSCNLFDYKKHVVKRNMLKGAACLITALMCMAQLAEFRVSSYRRAYFEALIESMYDIDNKQDSELSGFQANDVSQIRETIDYMKKYRLGVFFYLPEDGRFDQSGN